MRLSLLERIREGRNHTESTLAAKSSLKMPFLTEKDGTLEHSIDVLLYSPKNDIGAGADRISQADSPRNRKEAPFDTWCFAGEKP